jgi:hypothetical protein
MLVQAVTARLHTLNTVQHGGANWAEDVQASVYVQDDQKVSVHLMATIQKKHAKIF